MKSKEILIRPFQIKDIFSISKMYLFLSEEDRRVFHPCPFRWWIVIPIVTLLSIEPIVSKFIRVIFPRAAFLPLIAIDAATNRCAGFTYLQMRERCIHDRYIATLGIVVGDKYRNKGIGSQLVAGLINQAYEIKVDKIIITLLADNEAAFRLYQRHGFKLVNTVDNAEFWDGRFYTRLEEELILNKDKSHKI